MRKELSEFFSGAVSEYILEKYAYSIDCALDLDADILRCVDRIFSKCDDTDSSFANAFREIVSYINDTFGIDSALDAGDFIDDLLNYFEDCCYCFNDQQMAIDVMASVKKSLSS